MAFNIIQNIRLNLLVPFIGSLIIILLSGIWGLQIHHQSDQETFTQNINKQLENSFNQAINDNIDLIHGFLFFITTKNTLQQGWTQKNREALLRSSLPIFEAIKKQHNITHFYFHDLEGKNFLRVHSPNRHGDTINRPTLTRAIKTRSLSSGIEFGTFGQFVLRVVIPWKINGTLVGYVELGEEIDHILETLAENNNYELLLTLEKSYITENNLEKTAFFVQHKNSLNHQKHVFVLHKTISEITKNLSRIIDKKQTPLSSQYTHNEKTYLVSKINIINFNQKPIAALHYVLDISQKTNQEIALLKTLGVTVSIMSLVLISFYFYYSGKLQQLINTNIKALKNEIIDRKQAQREITRNQATLEDIIQERNMSLEESRKRYQTLFDKTADALLIIEGNAFVDCNQAALDMLHYTTKEDLCNTHPSILSPEYQPDGQLSETKADQMIKIAFEKGSHRFEWVHIRKNGDIFPVEVLLTSIPFESTPILHVVWRDITERKKSEAAIEHQAYYDHLTELPNRQLLLDRLKQALITSRAHHYYGALLFIDLDRFKSINDSLGHSAGDKLLVEASQRIKSCIFEEDTASRFGGDEYVVLLRHLGNHKEPASLTAKKISSRIQNAFRTPFIIDDQEVHITTSIGITLFPLEDENVEDIIKYADTAMYSAKENGRNQVAFYLSQMHEKVIQRLTLEKDLRNAIKANNLNLYYQPQIDQHGNIIAVEALLRWQHPTLDFINPEIFIGIAEDTGLIYELGEFVLHKSISDICEINQQPDNKNRTPLHLSVNISPHQFRKLNFVNIIRDLKEDYGLEKHFLTLELTEGIAIDNLDEAVRKFHELRDLGVRLSLDDFGTGYSSLSHLKRLPIDELKIDKSFVFDIEDDPQNALLIKTIIKIAHQFDLEVVAEGVESKEQLDFLKSEHCNIYQGYYYSKPIPLDQLKKLIQDANKKT